MGETTTAQDLRGPRTTAIELTTVTLLFAGLAVVMTWPQVRVIASGAQQHQDVFFNLWRLRWTAHALATGPTNLFNGNIFYPEPRTLTFSDAMLVEGVIATPLLWLGLPPVLVHNLLLLGAIVSSAVGIYVLARHLTGSRGGSLTAGIIFAFVPYRFDHYMHMELQWTTWTPLAFWAMHRTLETGSWRYGLLTGVFVALQMLSSIYYGVFLVTLITVSGLCCLLAARRDAALRATRALAAGAVLSGVVCAAYAMPYLETKEQMGGRPYEEMIAFSARPSSYLVATPDNVLWGESFRSRSRPERRLFPGALAVVLAMIGLLLRPPSKTSLVYLVGLVLAFEMSLGLSGYTFAFLFDRLAMFQGFRAMARLGIFVVFFLAVLAAYGYVALAADRGAWTRRILATAICAVLLLEYRVRPLNLVRYPNTAPPLYAWLAEQPRGVVAELPMTPDGIPGGDPAYSYLSTFHWHPIVNGYSGFYPQSYLDRLKDVAGFPDERSLRRLLSDNVRYVVVHLHKYSREEGRRVLEIARTAFGLDELGRFHDGHGPAVVLRLR